MLVLLRYFKKNVENYEGKKLDEVCLSLIKLKQPNWCLYDKMKLRKLQSLCSTTQFHTVLL